MDALTSCATSPGGSATYASIATICVRPDYNGGTLTRQVWDENGGASETYPALPVDLAYLYISRSSATNLVLGYIGTDLVQHPLYTATLPDFAGNNANNEILSYARTSSFDFRVGNLAVYTTSMPAFESISISGGRLIMEWTGGEATIQTNSDIAYGVWGDWLTDQTSPFTNAIGSEAKMFYRLAK